MHANLQPGHRQGVQLFVRSPEVSAGVRKGGIRTFSAHPTLCIGGTRGARRGQIARSRCLPGQIARWWYPSEAGRLRPELDGIDGAAAVLPEGRAAQTGAHRGWTAQLRCLSWPVRSGRRSSEEGTAVASAGGRAAQVGARWDRRRGRGVRRGRVHVLFGLICWRHFVTY